MTYWGAAPLSLTGSRMMAWDDQLKRPGLSLSSLTIVSGQTATTLPAALTCAEQQEIDEIIMRDINRTFPEHPFFGSAGGQTSLFRLLKAYSLQDVEAGYCQVR